MQRKLNKAHFLSKHKQKRSTSSTVSWIETTWSINGSGLAYCVPTLGSELLTNTEFTTNTTGWTAESGATLTRRDYTSSPNISPTGGLDNFGLEVSNSASALSRAAQTFVASVGNWIQVQSRIYSPSANATVNSAGLYTANTNSGAVLRNVTSEDAWQTILEISRVTAVSPQLKLTRGATANDLGHFDAPSVKTITLSTTLATVTGSSNNQTVAAKIHTLTTNTLSGVTANLDSTSNPQNFLVAYHDGTNVKLDKCVAGVYTSLVSTAVAFSSNAQIEIRRPSGNTYQVWYGGTQRGTDQTVSDSEIINNNLYGMFSTYSGNLISEFTLGGVVIPFTF